MRIGVVLPQTEIGPTVGAVRAYGLGVQELGYQHVLAYDHVVGADPAVHDPWRGPYAIDTQFPGLTERERFQESVRHLIDGLVSGLIEGTVAAARDSGARSFEHVRNYRTRIARFTSPTRETTILFKRFLYRNVYSSDILEKDRRDSTEKLDRVFEYLLAHPEKMSSGSGPRDVCDFIAGMTDRYFLRFHDALFSAP